MLELELGSEIGFFLGGVPHTTGFLSFLVFSSGCSKVLLIAAVLAPVLVLVVVGYVLLGAYGCVFLGVFMIGNVSFRHVIVGICLWVVIISVVG